MDRYSDYKDSEISWIPPLPFHWNRVQLKRILATPITDGPHETPELQDDGVPFLSAEAVKNLRLDFDLKRGFISEADHKRFCRKCKPRFGDIFMVKSGATTGNIAMVTTHDEFSVWSPLALIRSNQSRVDNMFLFQFLQSSLFRMEVELFWNYGTQQNIGMEVLGKQFVVLPTISEQKVISQYLKIKLGKIDTLLSDLQTQAEKLDIYRYALIANVVTKGLNISAPRKDSNVDWIGEYRVTGK